MARSFISNDNKNIFIVNFKCGFSSFCKLVELKKIRWLDINTINNYPSSNIYLIVRNPYNRFLSFYNEKFVSAYNNTHIQKENRVKLGKNNEQLCQKLLYKYHNKDDLFNMRFSITDLINCIKKGYKDYEPPHHTTSHMIKQSECVKNIKNINKLKIIKLEDTDYSIKLGKILGFKFPHENNNKSSNLMHLLDNKDKQFIYEYYKEDFEMFNY
tara:strand:+ start:7848 stop:8486 length:639 start_codon:yes stop_codon:yes gene_type:complete